MNIYKAVIKKNSWSSDLVEKTVVANTTTKALSDSLRFIKKNYSSGEVMSIEQVKVVDIFYKS